jgi:hypothetical protein
MAKRSADPSSLQELTGNRPKFPRPSDYAEGVYNSRVTHRDNSKFLEKLVEYRSLVFARPMQLGKTTLFSLAELLFSKSSTAPAGLAYDPPMKNTWYVLRVDFGDVNASQDETETWEDIARKYDTSALETIRYSIEAFLQTYEEVRNKVNMDDFRSLDGINLLRRLCLAIQACDKTATLLVLVDEYDQPVREVVLAMLENRDGAPYEQIEQKMKKAYPNYTGFFKACKVMAGLLPSSKTWLTGITPIALNVLSWFNPEVLTFNENMADMVGLMDEDVDRMLDRVHAFRPFKDDEEKEKVRKALRTHYNGLKLLSGSPLYHTRMINSVMESLMRADARQDWLKNLGEPSPDVQPEKPPSSVFNVVKSHICSLPEKHPLSGHTPRHLPTPGPLLLLRLPMSMSTTSSHSPKVALPVSIAFIASSSSCTKSMKPSAQMIPLTPKATAKSYPVLRNSSRVTHVGAPSRLFWAG